MTIREATNLRPRLIEGVENSFETVYRGILRGLFEGLFAPGQRLSEPELMQHFGVGRGTIREVLSRLEAAGVVQLVRYKGASIRRLTCREVNDVMDVVDALLRLAARRAAGHARSAEGRVRFQDAHDRLQSFEQLDDFGGFLAARENYYRTLVQLSGNREIGRLFPAVQVQIIRIQLRSFSRAADSMHFDDYRLLTEAILSGDGARADEAAHTHVQHTVDTIRELPQRAFAPEPEAQISGSASVEDASR